MVQENLTLCEIKFGSTILTDQPLQFTRWLTLTALLQKLNLLQNPSIHVTDVLNLCI